MTPFRYRLATLLKLRENLRDERRVELARATDAQEILLGTRRQLIEEAARIDQLQRSASGPLDVDELLAATRYRFSLSVQQKDLDAKLHTVSEEVERRRQALLEADRDVKSLEKLREIQSARHDQENARRETAALDEVALRGHFWDPTT